MKMEAMLSLIIFPTEVRVTLKKEVEVYSKERTLIMDNWRKLNGYGFKDSQVPLQNRIKDTLINLKLY